MRSRPPHRWCAPSLVFEDFNLLDQLQKNHEEVANPAAKFLWPALELQPAELWQVSEDTCFLSAKPISRTSFLECFRGLLIQSGVAPAEACTAQFNRLRRFAPTGALVLRLDPQDAQAVGSWMEAVQLPGQQGQRASRLMSVHYAGEQVQRGAIAKQHVLDQMLRLFRRKAADFRPDRTFTWEVVGKLHEASSDVLCTPPCLQPSAAQRGLLPSNESSASSQSISSVSSEQEGNGRPCRVGVDPAAKQDSYCS